MKSSMKKGLSALLVLVMLFAMASVAFAAEPVTPVIVVSGMGAFPLVNEETGESGWPLDPDRMERDIKKVIIPAAVSLTSGDGAFFAKHGLEYIYDLFEPLSCDENGDSVHNVQPQLFPGNAGQYEEVFRAEATNEKGIVTALGDKIGWDNTYFFYYDWRRNPLDIAEDLNETVKAVMQEKHCDKVSIVAASFGGTVTTSYLYKYGSDHLKNIVFASTAFCGVELVGRLFSNDIEIELCDAIRYFSSTSRDNSTALGELLGFTSDLLDSYGMSVRNAIDIYLAGLVSSLSEPLFRQVFAETFAHFQGIWCLMPAEYYESAKQYIPTVATISDSFLAHTDEYFENVMSKVPQLVLAAQENGANVYTVASYGYSGMPFTKAAANQTDNLIDTYLTSGYATVAPYGQTLENASGKFVSTDKIIDASTCIIPEQTWFIKYIHHVEYSTKNPTGEFITYIATSDERINVDSNSSFPQFMELDRETGNLLSLTQGVTLGEKSFFSFSNIFALLLKIAKKVLSMFIV